VRTKAAPDFISTFEVGVPGWGADGQCGTAQLQTARFGDGQRHGTDIVTGAALALTRH
jgi:hypothetical protein